MAWVALQVGDEFIFTTAFIVIGALLGFLAWNWPRGRIFLGDGGAHRSRIRFLKRCSRSTGASSCEEIVEVMQVV